MRSNDIREVLSFKVHKKYCILKYSKKGKRMYKKIITMMLIGTYYLYATTYQCTNSEMTVQLEHFPDNSAARVDMNGLVVESDQSGYYYEGNNQVGIWYRMRFSVNPDMVVFLRVFDDNNDIVIAKNKYGYSSDDRKFSCSKTEELYRYGEQKGDVLVYERTDLKKYFAVAKVLLTPDATNPAKYTQKEIDEHFLQFHNKEVYMPVKIFSTKKIDDSRYDLSAKVGNDIYNNIDISIELTIEGENQRDFLMYCDKYCDTMETIQGTRLLDPIVVIKGIYIYDMNGYHNGVIIKDATLIKWLPHPTEEWESLEPR